MACLAVLAQVLAASPGRAQGNDNQTQAATGAAKTSVAVGAGTSDATTTGSSGAKSGTHDADHPQAVLQPATKPADEAAACEIIQDATARNRCRWEIGRRPGASR
jgi:hypothetical protein